jgi:hypothetical protein
MTTSQMERYTDHQQQRAVVVWGCGTHRTPRGEVCRGCIDQGDLFGRSDVPQQRSWRKQQPGVSVVQNKSID